MTRTKTSCCVSVGVNARKSCSPTRTRAAASRVGTSSGRGNHHERRCSKGDRMRDRQMRYRYERDCAEKRAWKSGSAAAASTTAASSGSDVFSASAMRPTCGPPSTSTLAPIFAVALATHRPHYAFYAGLATAIGAGISMAFSEGLSDTGEITGRGNPFIRGSITGGGTFLGGVLHTLPFLIPHYRVAI